MSHGDQVRDLPADFEPIAATETCPHAAAKHRTKPIFGLQFHPEVTHTEHGSRLLANFVKNICGCRGSWRISDFIESEIVGIRERVGSNRVICGLSGGVDSSVVAALAVEVDRRSGLVHLRGQRAAATRRSRRRS